MSSDPFADQPTNSADDADLWGSTAPKKGGDAGNKPAKPPKPPVEPGKGPILADLPHREWVLKMIRERFLQVLKPASDSSATYYSAPTAEEIVDELLALQAETTDAYGNAIPKEPGKTTKVAGLKALKGKATKKLNGDGTIDNLDRNCVEAYLESLLLASDKQTRYQQLRAEYFARKPTPTHTKCKVKKTTTATPTTKSTNQDINWTVIICVGLVCVTVFLLFMLRR